MNHAMIDIEAMGKDNVHKIPLMNIGVAIFDENGLVSSGIDIYVKQETLPRWATPEPETQEWWRQQKSWPLLQKRILADGTSCKKALKKMMNFITENNCEGVWFNGPLYDAVCLEAYMKWYAIKGWEYHQVRDFRTVRKQYSEILKKYPRGDTAHLGMDDAISQCSQLWFISQHTGHKWV